MLYKCHKTLVFTVEKHEADDDPLPSSPCAHPSLSSPCVHSKRLRVYVVVCAGTTRTRVSTCARGAGTHGDVSNVHMGGFSVSHHRHHVHSHTTQHTTSHGDRDREGRQRRERENTRQDERRHDLIFFLLYIFPCFFFFLKKSFLFFF